MADNLPLIPSKRRGCGGDVRPVLRDVFRERIALLPPLAMSGPAGEVERGSELTQREAQLQYERAQRLARRAGSGGPSGRPSLQTQPPIHADPLLLRRADLMPTVYQTTGNASFWVSELLNCNCLKEESHADLRARGSVMNSPRSMTLMNCDSAQSVSAGELVLQTSPPLPPPPPRPLLPEYVVAVPPRIEFVNFTVGMLYSMPLRLVNVSPTEVRLSLRPPVQRELDVQLCGRLLITSGSITEMIVLFRPTYVRPLRDELKVRVSQGRPLRITIACYMQPPILNVLVLGSTSSLKACLTESVDSNVGSVAVNDELDLGSRLLGDVHHALLLLRSSAAHASFFLMSEDMWLSMSLSEVIEQGTLTCGAFVVSPVWWQGGGIVRGAVWCVAPHVGLHTTTLRVVSSTAVVRPVTLLADSLYFYPQHITMQAHEKDYDICSEDSDPDCDYYLNLGNVFPGRGLDGTFQLTNHSSLTYSYVWSVRKWGVCSCWQDELAERDLLSGEDDSEQHLCPGALASKQARVAASAGAGENSELEDEAALHVAPERGSLHPSNSLMLQVTVPDVGTRLGTHRAVLVLILENIPRRSFPPGYVPMVVATSFPPSKTIPGRKLEEQEVCSVVCRQVEVWWRVAPLRFVLDPPMLILPHSRRVKSIELLVRVTQLFEGGAARVAWRGPMFLPGGHAAPALVLQAAQPAYVTLHLPLSVLPNPATVKDTITLESARGEWSSSVVVLRRSDTRHPALQPAITWLGLVPPGAPQAAQLELLNDTHQHICWWADTIRWLGENPPKDVCLTRAACDTCHERRCTCSMLRPMRGALPVGNMAQLRYLVNAPDSDGCVVTLVRVRRTEGDVSHVPGLQGACARASLLSYRVLAPQLVLDVVQCGGGEQCCRGSSCELAGGGGGAVLRPARALVVGRSMCCRLRVTNLTPLPTCVTWEPLRDQKDFLRVKFIPNEFRVEGHSTSEIRVVVEAWRVCSRRVWARRARVLHAPRPLYLLVDCCIAGVELECWLPLGDVTVCVRRMQREVSPGQQPLPCSAQDAFTWDDEQRRLRAGYCECKIKMTWVPPPPSPPRPSHPEPEIPVVSQPPSLTRVCACQLQSRPLAPAPQHSALQLRAVPLRTVRTLRVRLRSVCGVTARWLAAPRYGHVNTKHDPLADVWAGRLRQCGVCVSCAPARGVLAARDAADVQVRVYGDTWGIYRDQILIMVEELEPLVVDLWVEVVGHPLQFVLRPTLTRPPSSQTLDYQDMPPTLWLSEDDPVRYLRSRNSSRAPLLLHAYVLREHVHEQNAYPFRLYMRMLDLPPRTCSCMDFDESLLSLQLPEVSESGYSEEMDTGIELYLAPDCGVQDDDYITVEPDVLEVMDGGVAEWRVSLRGKGRAPPHALLLRTQPLQQQGPGWFRNEPAPAVVRLRVAEREGRLQVSHSRLTVKLCAIDLPPHGVTRVRKRLCVRNVGSGTMCVRAATVKDVNSCPCAAALAMEGGAPCGGEARVTWSVLRDKPGDGEKTAAREQWVDLILPPRSATELSVEVCVATQDVWPTVEDVSNDQKPAELTDLAEAPDLEGDWRTVSACSLASKEERFSYDLSVNFTSELLFGDGINILERVLLRVEVDVPALRVEPQVMDFGYVCDGDTHKSYFTVSHTSRTETLSVSAHWEGGAEARLHPTRLQLAPGAEGRLYLQYCAKWIGGQVWEGEVLVCAAGAAGAWCRACVCVRARPSRDYRCHAAPRDHTDDTRLLPPHLLLPTRPPPAQSERVNVPNASRNTCL